MNYLLDTDTLIYWLKGHKNIENKALSVGLNHTVYSIISHAELYFGAYNSEQKDKKTKRQKLERYSNSSTKINGG